MPYSNFTLKRVKTELKVNVVENKDLFSEIKEKNREYFKLWFKI